MSVAVAPPEIASPENATPSDISSISAKPSTDRPSDWAPLVWLIGALAIRTVLWLAYPHEFVASDPWYYSIQAFRLIHDFQFSVGDIFDHRIGVLLPVGMIYRTIGVNILTTHLWPFCAVVIIALVVWLALPDQSSRIAGAILSLTTIPLFEASTALYPDVIATAFMAWSSLLLFRRRAPVLAMVTLFVAFLAKESAYWVLPLWVIAFASDLRGGEARERIRRFYRPALLTAFCLGVAYLVFCYAVWGDPFARIRTVQALTGGHLWSWSDASASALRARLLTDPLKQLLGQYGPLLLILGASGFALASSQLRQWGMYSACCVGFYWFGSTSFTQYEPMPISDRMLLPFTPGLIILAAYATSRITVKHVSAIGRRMPMYAVLLLTAIPFLQFVNSWRYVNRAEAEAMAVIQQDVNASPDAPRILVCSDERSTEALSFYFGYRPPNNLRIVSVQQVREENLDGARIFVFVNRQRSEALHAMYGTRHYDVEIESLNLRPAYQGPGVALFVTDHAEDLVALMNSL